MWLIRLLVQPLRAIMFEAHHDASLFAYIQASLPSCPWLHNESLALIQLHLKNELDQTIMISKCKMKFICFELYFQALRFCL